MFFQSTTLYSCYINWEMDFSDLCILFGEFRNGFIKKKKRKIWNELCPKTHTSCQMSPRLKQALCGRCNLCVKHRCDRRAFHIACCLLVTSRDQIGGWSSRLSCVCGKSEWRLERGADWEALCRMQSDIYTPICIHPGQTGDISGLNQHSLIVYVLCLQRNCVQHFQFCVLSCVYTPQFLCQLGTWAWLCLCCTPYC